jgi:hypothetical protein
MLEKVGRLYVGRESHAMHSLRVRLEPDNFSCSHRCTSGATLVRGALVLATPARPASLPVLGLGTLFVLSGLAPAPKSCGLVLPELGHAFFRPEPDSCPSYHACRWSRNLFFTNPFVKRSALNSQLTCRFGNGVACHHKNTQPVYFVNRKKLEPGKAHFAPFRAPLENIAPLAAIVNDGRPMWCHGSMAA